MADSRTTTIALTSGERDCLINHALFQASDLGEDLDRTSADRVAIVRDMHAQLGRITRLLDDLERDEVPASDDLLALARALQGDAIAAMRTVEADADIRAHRARAVCAEAVLRRLEDQ
jgi:hypothetical protein